MSATSSTGPGSADVPTMSAATVTSPAVPDPTTTTDAADQPTIGSLLAGFPAGAITVDHMPTADPAWLARVQTESSAGGRTGLKVWEY